MSTNGGTTIGDLLRRVHATPVALPGANVGSVYTAEEQQQAATVGHVESLMMSIAAVIGKELKRRDERIAALEKTVGELKRREAEHDGKIFSLENDVSSKVCYRGLWRAETPYRPSDVVTRGGRLWFCNIQTADRPGSSSAWRMMDKEDEGRR